MNYLSNFKEILERVDAINSSKSESYEELLTLLKPILLSKIRRFFGYTNPAMDDLIQEGYVKSICLIKNFDPKRNTIFLGYFNRMISWFYFDLKKDIQAKLDSELYTMDGVYEPTYNDSSFNDVELDEILSVLSPRDKDFIIAHIFHDKPLKQVAVEFNLSYSYSKELKKKILLKLAEDKSLVEK